MKENRFLIALGVFFLLLVIFNEVIVDKVVNQVIKKLQRDYGPSPYSPGINPDKLDIEKIKK